MARQVIDTAPPIGDPAPTAFGKVNAMTAELYPLATGALQKTGGILSGDLSIQKNVVVASYLSPNGQVGYRVLVNISDSVDGGYTIQRVSNSGSLWSDCLKINNDRTANFASTVTAVSFNPTSSADVKDFIVGYEGDADAELERFVVIEYSMRPEFAETGKRFVGLLAENVRDVKPDATDGGIDREIEIEVPIPYPYGEAPEATFDEHGNPLPPPPPPTETVVVREYVPLNYDMAQILALNTRAHQQKSKRIRDLEAVLEAALLRIAALEAAA